MPFFGNKRRDFSIQPPRQQVDGTPFFVTDSDNIDFTLENLNLTANLTLTGVAAGTYGDATHIPILEIDQWGRVTGVTIIGIGGGGGTYSVDNGLTPDPFDANKFQLGGTIIKPTVITVPNTTDNIRFDAPGALNSVGAYWFNAIAGAVHSPTDVLVKFKGDDCIAAQFISDAIHGSGATAVNIVSQAASVTALYIKSTTNGDLLKINDIGQLILGQYTTSTSFASGLTSVGVLNVDNTGKVFVGPGGGVPATRKVDTTDSLTGGGDLSADRTLKLVNDTPSPGANKVYGTDGSGNRTWKSDPTGGGILHGTAAGTDTYTVTITGATAYADGDAYLIRFTNGNTTSCTLNISDGVSSFGAVPLYRNNDGQLIGGDIVAGGEMLCVYNSTTNRFQVIGTAPNTLLSYVTNDDTVTLTKGMAVFAFGGVGDRMTVQRASNLSDSTSAQTVGLVLSSSIAPNQKGLIMMQGLLDGLNILPTATWNDGDPVFLGDTPGSITKTKPYAPKHLVYLGVVTTANNGSAGRMYVKVQNGYELDELHNVQAQSPNLNDTLYYDNTVTPAQWKTTSVNTLLNTSIKTGSFGVTVDGITSVVQVGQVGYVVMPYAGQITGWSITANASGNISFDITKASGAIPTVTIITSGHPTLSGTNFFTSTTVSGWDVNFAAGDVFGFTVRPTPSIIKNATLTIRVTKT